MIRKLTKSRKNHKSHTWGSVPVTLTNLSLVDKFFVAASLMAVAVFSFPGLASAEVQNQTPLVFQIQNPHYLTAQIQDLPIADEYPEDMKKFTNYPKDIRAPILEEYLRSKGSPVAEHAEMILQLKNYRYVLAISFAEGNFCKHQIRAYNCWGIGGSRPEVYGSYAESFARADNLIQKYFDRGMDTPEKMRTTWVGWHNDNWIRAVNQILGELQSIGL